jgi:uncharacterized protein involved in type VI secretion and phage assembly
VESDNEFFSFMGLFKELVTSNRPLRLRLDLPGGLNDDMLLPQRVFGSETLCGGIEYRILCVTAQNNLPKVLAARVERMFARSRWMQGVQELQMQEDVTEKVVSGPLRMHIQFTAVRRGVTIVPAYDARIDLPQALMQSAIVVGPEGEEVHCDQMGRVKIRFPGTRAVDHEEAANAGASNTSLSYKPCGEVVVRALRWLIDLLIEIVCEHHCS